MNEYRCLRERCRESWRQKVRRHVSLLPLFWNVEFGLATYHAATFLLPFNMEKFGGTMFF